MYPNIRQEFFPNICEKCGDHIVITQKLNVICLNIFLKIEDCEGGSFCMQNCLIFR
jgi:hypothetical protein